MYGVPSDVQPLQGKKFDLYKHSSVIHEHFENVLYVQVLYPSLSFFRGIWVTVKVQLTKGVQSLLRGRASRKDGKRRAVGRARVIDTHDNATLKDLHTPGATREGGYGKRDIPRTLSFVRVFVTRSLALILWGFLDFHQQGPPPLNSSPSFRPTKNRIRKISVGRDIRDVVCRNNFTTD